MKYSKPIAIFIMLLGLAVIVNSFFSGMLELLIALLIIGVGLICSGIAQLGLIKDVKRDEERHHQIMEKLDKIEKDLERLEQPRNTGVAIADVISSGLKYYTEHLTGPKKGKDND